MINQRTFQTNMSNMLVTSQQNTIDCIMNNQATLQQTLQAQLNLFELSTEQQALRSPPMLLDPEILADSDLLTLAPSALVLPTSTTSSIDNIHLPTTIYICNHALPPYSKTYTRPFSISLISSRRTHNQIDVVFKNLASLSNSYMDPPIPNPYRLNLPPSRAKKKEVYLHIAA
jgi:hypothetical protein